MKFTQRLRDLFSKHVNKPTPTLNMDVDPERAQLMENVLRTYKESSDLSAVVEPLDTIKALAAHYSDKPEVHLYQEQHSEQFKAQRSIDALSDAAEKHGQTLQQFLCDHRPQDTTLHDRYMRDLAELNLQFMKTNPQDISPFQFEEIQPYTYDPAVGRTHDFKTGVALKGAEKPIYNPNAEDAQSAFWQHCESVKNLEMEGAGDTFKIRADDKRHIDEKIKDLIVAAELRFGSGNYGFRGDSEFKARAQEIMRTHGKELRALARKQALRAEQWLQANDPTLYAQLKAYTPLPPHEERLNTLRADIQQKAAQAETAKLEELKANIEKQLPTKGLANEADRIRDMLNGKQRDWQAVVDAQQSETGKGERGDSMDLKPVIEPTREPQPTETTKIMDPMAPAEPREPESLDAITEGARAMLKPEAKPKSWQDVADEKQEAKHERERKHKDLDRDQDYEMGM